MVKPEPMFLAGLSILFLALGLLTHGLSGSIGTVPAFVVGLAGGFGVGKWLLSTGVRL